MSDILKIAILVTISASVLASIYVHIQSARPIVHLNSFSLAILTQSDFIDFNSRIYLNSTQCRVVVNGLQLLTLEDPDLVIPNCAATPLNSTWIDVRRRNDECLLSFNPVFRAENATLIIFNATERGWTDRLCLMKLTREVRIYKPRIEVCGSLFSLDGPTVLKLVLIEVKRC